MKLTKSQSHCIKAVYELSADANGVHVCNIAERFGVLKAGASLAMQS